MNERSRGARYAISALTNKRATLAAEIVQLERQIRSRKDGLQHVDACLRLLDPSIAVEDIPNKRLPKHVNIFRQGELGRRILGVLREAEGKPLSTPEIATAIMETDAIPSEARNTIRIRVRSGLGYLQRNGKVSKLGSMSDARWRLAD
jgi:hypothetical protein